MYSSLFQVVSFWFLLRTTSAFQITRGIYEPLYEPKPINLTYDGAKTVLYVRLCNYTVMNSTGFTFIQMKRYCYCRDKIDIDDESCSYPGPPLLMKSNTSINVTVINQLTGSTTVYGPSSQFINSYKDMDTTNIHVHGLHVNPVIDDILVNITAEGHRHEYLYKIKFHYPGTFWYHAHHHGSTTWQVNAGLHGAILMTSDDPDEVKLKIYKENVLMFNWQYAVPAFYCNDNKKAGPSNENCTGTGGVSDTLYESRFSLSRIIKVNPPDDYSMCDVYCSFPVEQLLDSGYVYDVQTDISFNHSFFQPRKKFLDTSLLLFFVNGQISPVIHNLTTGIYHRLRFVNSLSNWYLQFKFPDECDWHLIATDGVYIGSHTFMNYNLANISHQNELIMTPGGRVDLMVRCNNSGIYDIYSSENNDLDPTLSFAYTRVYAGYKLFSIKVNNRTNPLSFYNGAHLLPTKYATKPTGTYIEDLSTPEVTDELQTKCNCTHTDTTLANTNLSNDDCYFKFNLIPQQSVNGKPFGFTPSSSYPYLSDSLKVISKNKPYEFSIDNDGDINTPPIKLAHAYHQHISPFQVQTFIGHRGFTALPKTWWDTLGNYPRNYTDYIKARFWTRDYDGLVIVHCHLLQHEDKGMMGFFNIVNQSLSEVCPYTPTPTASPTKLPSKQPSNVPTDTPLDITSTDIEFDLTTTDSIEVESTFYDTDYGEKLCITIAVLAAISIFTIM